jgi:hypothetical protein
MGWVASRTPVTYRVQCASETLDSAEIPLSGAGPKRKLALDWLCELGHDEPNRNSVVLFVLLS